MQRLAPCFAAVAVFFGLSLDGGAAPLTIGFSQSDTAESDWRKANTESFKEAANAMGITLVFKDAGGKTDVQRQHVQELIDAKVSAIVLAANEVHGWDDVLLNAKKAKIPVILEDRTIQLKPDNVDTGLYVAWVGANFRYEGRAAAAWLAQETGGRCLIVEIQGPRDAAPSLERAQGFRDVIALFPAMKIIRSKAGMWRTEQAKRVMDEFLKAEGKNICAVFAHNDNMAIGAVEAIEQNKKLGLRSGTDVLVIGVDAVSLGFEHLIAGRLNALVECNPILGEVVLKVVKQILAGQRVPPVLYTEERVFTVHNAKAALPTRRY